MHFPIKSSLLNPTDILIIGLISLLFVWLANRGLRMIGLGRFSTDSPSTAPSA